MRLLLIPALSMCLMAGSCLPTPKPVYSGPLFCDVEEPRRFTRSEISWRQVNAPANLARDYRTNLAWDRECAGEVTE
jgi:hypothetical protein